MLKKTSTLAQLYLLDCFLLFGMKNWNKKMLKIVEIKTNHYSLAIMSEN